MRGYKDMSAVCSLEENPLRTQPAFITVRNKFLLLISHTIQDIFVTSGWAQIFPEITPFTFKPGVHTGLKGWCFLLVWANLHLGHCFTSPFFTAHLRGLESTPLVLAYFISTWGLDVLRILQCKASVIFEGNWVRGVYYSLLTVPLVTGTLEGKSSGHSGCFGKHQIENHFMTIQVKDYFCLKAGSILHCFGCHLFSLQRLLMVMQNSITCFPEERSFSFM